MNLNKIFSFENLMEAHKLCRRSKQHKRGAIMFEIELGRNIAKLADDLAKKKYKLGKYRQFTIFDPKKRLIEALPYKDRVVLMCFCKYALEPRLDCRLIYDNAASRKGKGPEFAIERLSGFVRRLCCQKPEEDIYFLKCDIAKYFQNINHKILLEKLRRCGFSDDEMWFMEQVIRSHGEIGVPLGNQTSQWFALLYLDEIDRLAKERLRAPFYIRYMDDFVLLSKDKAFLQRCRNEIGLACRENLKLQLNAKTQIGKLKDGLDFLGYNFKLTVTGKLLKSLRASARRRQRHYIKMIARYYLQDVLDDEYLNVRFNAFKAHMKGTFDWKFARDRLNSLKKKKRLMKKAKDKKSLPVC